MLVLLGSGNRSDKNVCLCLKGLSFKVRDYLGFKNACTIIKKTSTTIKLGQTFLFNEWCGVCLYVFLEACGTKST